MCESDQRYSPGYSTNTPKLVAGAKKTAWHHTRKHTRSRRIDHPLNYWFHPPGFSSSPTVVRCSVSCHVFTLILCPCYARHLCWRISHRLLTAGKPRPNPAAHGRSRYSYYTALQSSPGLFMGHCKQLCRLCTPLRAWIPKSQTI